MSDAYSLLHRPVTIANVDALIVAELSEEANSGLSHKTAAAAQQMRALNVLVFTLCRAWKSGMHVHVLLPVESSCDTHDVTLFCTSDSVTQASRIFCMIRNADAGLNNNNACISTPSAKSAGKAVFFATFAIC